MTKKLDDTPVRKRESTGRLAFLVAAGILLSRIIGLVRLRVFSHYFGLRSDSADAFNAAFRIPNFLQNLFGEGVLSASFIPVYARLLAEGEEEEAGKVAGAVGATLALAVAVLCLAGVLATPWLIDIIAPGFSGSKRDLTISLVRILFPGAGLLVFSAWCLGILNSHRKLFLSYAAPVMWSAAMIATLVIFGGRSSLSQLAITLAWGSVVGSALQFGIQLPVVLRLSKNMRLRLDLSSDHVRTVIRNFAPVFVSRGVVQISAYIDALLASLLPTGAVTGLINAQLDLCPAGELVWDVGIGSRTAGDVERDWQRAGNPGSAAWAAGFRAASHRLFHRAIGCCVPCVRRFDRGRAAGDGPLYTRRCAICLGHSGWVFGWLACVHDGAIIFVGLLRARDTRTPLKFAVLRVALTTVLGYICAKPLPLWLGIDPRWGVAGLTASAGVAGWVEFALLRRGMHRTLGAGVSISGFVAKLWLAAALAVWDWKRGSMAAFCISSH